MLRYKRLLLCTLCFCTVGITNIYGQMQLSLYPLNKTIPQAHQLNPAFMPDWRVVIGLPVLSSTQLSFDNDDIGLNDVLRRNEDGDLEAIPDKDEFISKLRDVNDLDLNVNVDLLFLGIRAGGNYFTLSARSRWESTFNYTKDLVTWGLRGPGTEDLVEPLSTDNFSLDGSWFHEVALGYSRKINDRLNVGLRAKYLKGVLNITTESSTGSLMANIDSISLVADDFLVQTSGIEFFNTDDPASQLLIANSNNGFAVDVGAEYEVLPRLTLSASVLDIGSIKWKDYNKGYRLQNASYNFNGFDVLDLLKSDTITKDFLSAEIDTIRNRFDPEEILGEIYSSNIQTKYYIGATYEFLRGHKVGGLVYSAFYKGDLRPAFSLNYNFQARSIFNGVVNTSFIDGRFNNIGVGLSVNFGFLQIYSTTNALTSMIYPARASVLDVRLGINFMFGKIREVSGFAGGSRGAAEGNLDAPRAAPTRNNVNPTGTTQKVKHDPKKVNKNKQKRIKKQYKQKKRKKYN